MRILAISLACAAAIFAAQPVFAAPVSRVVAVVNGDMITSRELERAVKPEFIGQQIDPKKSPEMADMIRKAVLDRMVNEKILLQQAEKDGIKVSDEQIDKALEALVAESGLSREAFLAKMEKDGLTEKMLRDQSRTHIASQMVMSRNVVKKVVVTEEEINDYYRKNMAGFAESRAHVAILVYAPDANAEKWAADIASGKVSFADAARKVSVGPNAENGGDLGVMAVSDMAPGMAQVVSGLSEGSVSPLLNLGEAKAQVMLIDLEEAEGAADAKPDAETARRIENILRNPRVQERFQQYTTELRQKALVDIRL
ncbi:MAG: SurA N-terminal domain-containing protein [Mailhella sp.]|nr:SurA N-terminal domain-containing protein [Mailhella sp.]